MNRFYTVVGAVVLGCSPGCGFVASGTAVAASTALIVGGKGSYAHLTDEQMSAAFGGYFAGYDRRVSVDFPGTDNFKQSVQVGETNLYGDVYATSAADPNGVITIGGVSEGAPAVTAVLKSLAHDLQNPPAGVTVPDPEHLNAAVYGYPSKALRLGTDFQPFPETPYNLLFVFAEYDGVADFPDNPFNLLAVINAVMGGDQLHVDDANFPILSQPTEWVSVVNGAGGRTTTIMIPTSVLPILEPLQNAGASPQTIANLDHLLRPMIDRAYHRPAMTSGVVPATVVPRPPGYTPPPVPAAMVATSTAMAAPAAETPAPARVDHARIHASTATSPVATTTGVVSDLPAPPASVVTTEDENTDPADGSPEPASGEDAVGDSTAGDQQREGNTAVDSTETGVESSDESADANKTGGRHRARANASHPDNGGTAAGSSASGGGKHSAERKFGHHK